MRKIQVIVDSTNDLSNDLIEKYGIKVIPLYINFNEDSFRDGITINTEKLYTLVDKYGCLPKTAAISVKEFYDIFKEYLDNDYDIICVTISSKMSSTYQNAVLASEDLDTSRIKVIDSKNLSTGIGINVIKACKDILAGLDLETVASNMLVNREKVRCEFAIPTMDYLYKGGRCSGMAKIFGTVLKIKPIIEVVDGSMQVGKKPHGKMKVALDAMLKDTLKNKDLIDKDLVIVTHSLAFEDAKYLKEELGKELVGANIIDTIAGCTISSHCGRGTIGIIYMLK